MTTVVQELLVDTRLQEHAFVNSYMRFQLSNTSDMDVINLSIASDNREQALFSCIQSMLT